MFTSASAYDFLVAKPDLYQTQSLFSYVQVLHMLCARTSVEQKQCYNVGVLPLELSAHAERSTLSADGHTVMW